MASAEYAFQDILPEGSGDEILVHGGVILAPDAGPQRGWTETYASLNGEPYALASQSYDKSAVFVSRHPGCRRAAGFLGEGRF